MGSRLRSAAGLFVILGVLSPGCGADGALTPGDGLGEGLGEGVGEVAAKACLCGAAGAGSGGRPGNSPPGDGVEGGGGLGFPNVSSDGLLGISSPSGATIWPASGGCT